MSNIVRFSSEEEFMKYLLANVVCYIGEGSEGVCYKGRDGLAYKEAITGPKNGFPTEDYVLEEIITSSDTTNKSFAFPHTLFAVKDKFVGYTADLVSCNLIDDRYMVENGIHEINFVRLIDAYYVMRDDAIKLAEQGIGIYDLTYNLMFDGYRLVGVDTCGYYKTKEDMKEENVNRVENAIKKQFADYLLFEYDYEIDEQNIDVVSFLRKIEYEFQYKNKRKYIIK